MGTTIHFKGRLSSPDALSVVEGIGLAFAAEHGWRHEAAPQSASAGDRPRGIVYFPHPDCEPLHLIFDDELVVDDFVKTQFAGSSVHVAVVQFLRALTPHFSALEVFDEGEYWDTSDATALEESMSSIDRRLAAELKAFPGSIAAVHEANGRITDLYRARTPEAVAALAAAFSPPPASADRRPWWRRLFQRSAV